MPMSTQQSAGRVRSTYAFIKAHRVPISIVAPALGCNVQKRAGERPPAPFPFSVLTLNFLLPLHLPLIRDHLSGDDVRIDRHRLIAARADLDVVAPRRQAERLRGRTEVRDLARELAVD